MDCINCGKEITNNFCANCGQRSNVKRINFKEGWLDFWSRVYGFDGMFPRTLKDLTIRPGEVARTYINGNRIKYYGPVGYFFFMITVCLLIFSLIGVDYAEYMRGIQKNFSFPQGQGKTFERVIKFITENLKVFAFLIIPFQALSARFLFFKKVGYNFLEHMVLPFYIFGHMYWFSLMFGVLYGFSGISFAGFNPFVMVMYSGLAYSGFEFNNFKSTSFLKGIGNFIVGQLLFLVALVLMVFLIIPWVAPDLYDSIRPSNN
jgi:hypothetical protein